MQQFLRRAHAILLADVFTRAVYFDAMCDGSRNIADRTWYAYPHVCVWFLEGVWVQRYDMII